MHNPKVPGSNPGAPTLNEPIGNDGFFVYTLSNFFKAQTGLDG